MTREVIIDISAAGSVNIEAKGFTGNACAKATEEIEIVLGGEGKKTKKPEFFNPATNAVGNKLTF